MLRVCLFTVLLFSSLIGISQTKTFVLNINSLPKGYKLNQAKPLKDSIAAYQALYKEVQQLQFNGYFDIDIIESTFKNDTLNATLYLGELYKGLFLTNGNIAPELINDLNLKEQFQKNKPLDLKDLSKTYTSLLNYYQNNGYPFAQVWLDSLENTNNQLAAKVFINPNKKILIDTLRLVGSASLSQAFLSSYLGLKNGQN